MTDEQEQHIVLTEDEKNELVYFATVKDWRDQNPSTPINSIMPEPEKSPRDYHPLEQAVMYMVNNPGKMEAILHKLHPMNEEQWEALVRDLAPGET